jgi:tryptophan-rich sensory protein
MMAFAGWLVWKDQQVSSSRKQTALILFGVQLTLNALWSFVFFEWHLLGWALVEILILWAAIVATLIAFLRIRKAAGWLLVPYLAWVSFASFLTYTIWTLNR